MVDAPTLFLQPDYTRKNKNNLPPYAQFLNLFLIPESPSNVGQHGHSVPWELFPAPHFLMQEHQHFLITQLLFLKIL